MKKLLFLIAILAIQVGCMESDWLEEGDYFFLKHKEAVMPIWVAGNIESGVFIITNHGGPLRNSAHDFRISKTFRQLEEDYAVVYWDQRMSGMAQGDASIDDLSIDQNIEDLGMLVDLIEHKYQPVSMFMMGHSWGGTLTGGYLGRGDNQDKFNGWIDLNGSIQDEFEGQAKKEWILERIPEQLEKNENNELWQYIVDWYEENPNPVESDWQPYAYVGLLGGDVYDYEKSLITTPIPYKDLIFSSPYTLAFYWAQQDSQQAEAWIDGYDVTNEVSNITIPSVLIWGANDGIVPVSTSDFTYNLLGTDPSEKEIILIDECGHAPFVEKPQEMYQAIYEFVERNK